MTSKRDTPISQKAAEVHKREQLCFLYFTVKKMSGLRGYWAMDDLKQRATTFS